jgi:hypothetical protein
MRAPGPFSRQGGLIGSGALGGPPQFHYTTNMLCKYRARAPTHTIYLCKVFMRLLDGLKR